MCAETRLFIIGADRGGRLLEIVAVPAVDLREIGRALTALEQADIDLRDAVKDEVIRRG